MTLSSMFIFSGESSGDLHGEKLLRHLQEKLPQMRVFGVGGPKMRAAGIECILPMEHFQVMGFIDVFFSLPKLLKRFFFLRKYILRENPNIVFFIDYPGFSLALAKSLRKGGYKGKICQYICPSVWAWGKKRIPKIEQTFDHLFVIFPFEKNLFNPKNLQVNYVGHPLVQELSSQPISPIDTPENRRILALFPGSRRKELIGNFPKQIRVAKQLLQEHPDLHLIISIAQPSFFPLLKQLLQSENISFETDQMQFVEASRNKALLQQASLAIAKSGTINLELALQCVPTIVTYAIKTIDLFIAKVLMRIHLPYYCIVNILAEKEIYPELYGPNFTEKSLYIHAKKWLLDEKLLQQSGEKCREIRTILEEKHPEEEILQAIRR